jgi:hypothetical protein
LAIELKAKSLANALALIITSPDASAANVAPVRLGLWVHVGVAVNLKDKYEKPHTQVTTSRAICAQGVDIVI